MSDKGVLHVFIGAPAILSPPGIPPSPSIIPSPPGIPASPSIIPSPPGIPPSPSIIPSPPGIPASPSIIPSPPGIPPSASIIPSPPGIPPSASIIPSPPGIPPSASIIPSPPGIPPSPSIIPSPPGIPPSASIIPSPPGIPASPSIIPSPPGIPPSPTIIPSPPGIPPSASIIPSPPGIPPSPSIIPSPPGIPPLPSIIPSPPVIPSPRHGADTPPVPDQADVWNEKRLLYNARLALSTSLDSAECPAECCCLVPSVWEEHKSLKLTTHRDGQSTCEEQTCETRQEEGITCTADISGLVSSTELCKITATSEDLRGSLHESLSQYLDASFPTKSEQEVHRTPNDNLETSANTEFLAVLMCSQVAVLGREEVSEQVVNCELQEATSGACSREMESATLAPRDSQDHCVCQQASQGYYASSLELFTPSSNGVLSGEGIPCQEDVRGLVEAPGLCAEELSKGTESSQCRAVAFKRARTCEELATSTHLHIETQQSKKAKQSNSPVKNDARSCQMRKAAVLNPSLELSLLTQCIDRTREYSVLVAALQPSHIKEVQVKTGLKAGFSVPLATLVVLDQSEMERKVVLWRGAAFWTLAVFPGDILMLTNVTVYEDKWNKETLLQSTGRSRLINLGGCSTLCLQDVSSMENGKVIYELLDYVSTKHSYLRALPAHQPQKLDQIPCVRLGQLIPDTLVHCILKVVAISTLTECIYQYKGLQQKKIILTVEEVKGCTCTVVLWGSCITWCDQIQRKKDHIWEIRNLFVRRSGVSGDMELHSTPWSSCECLFDDDRRAVEFKQRYHKSEAAPTKQMDIQALLEEKCSGEAQVTACILQLELTIPGHPSILLDQDTTLSDILIFLSALVYSGCGKCRRELKTDANLVYEQCYSCLPFNQVKSFYRPVRMTAVSEECGVRVHVSSDLLEKIFLNISPDSLDKCIVSSSEVTYRLIVADLVHSLLAGTGESHLLKIRSHFELDENSVPLEQDFFLLDFYLIL